MTQFSPNIRDVRGRSRTWVETGTGKIRSLSEPLGMVGPQITRAAEVFQSLLDPWGHQMVPNQPGWASDITDDHSPYEISVALEPGRRDLRMLVEAQSEESSARARWDAAVALTHRLSASDEAASMDRFSAIEHLFAPDERVPAAFGLWHAAVVNASSQVLYKTYFNPQILGPSAAPALVQEALQRLGIGSSWEAIQQLLSVGARYNRLLYFSLDLANSAEARVKVYVAHYGVEAATLDRQLLGFPSYEPGHVLSLVRDLVGTEGPFDERPILTCLSFSGARPEPDVTCHFPVRCYAESDAEVVDRLSRLLGRAEVQALRTGLTQYAKRDLHAGRGLVTYVSIRNATERKGARTVLYLSPETFAVEPPMGQSKTSETGQSVLRYREYPSLARPRGTSMRYALSDVAGYVQLCEPALQTHSLFKKSCTNPAATGGSRDISTKVAFFWAAAKDLADAVGLRGADLEPAKGSAVGLFDAAMRETRKPVYQLLAVGFRDESATHRTTVSLALACICRMIRSATSRRSEEVAYLAGSYSVIDAAGLPVDLASTELDAEAFESLKNVVDDLFEAAWQLCNVLAASAGAETENTWAVEAV